MKSCSRGKNKTRSFAALLVAFALVIALVASGTGRASALERRLRSGASNWPGGVADSVGDTDNSTTSNYTAVSITAAEYPQTDELQLLEVRDYLNLQEGSLLKVVQVPDSDGRDSSDFDLTLRLVRERDGIDMTLDKTNYYLPVKQTLTASDGRTCDIFIIAIPQTRSYSTDKSVADYLSAGELLIKSYKDMASVYWNMVSSYDFPARAGGLHPASRRALLALSYGMQPYISPRNSGVFPPDNTVDAQRAAGWLLETNYFSPEQAEAIFNTVFEYYLDYVQIPIAMPDLLGIEAAGSIGQLQEDGSYVLYYPAGLNMQRVQSSVIYNVADISSVAVSVSGAWKLGGISALTLTAKDPATWHSYGTESEGMIQTDTLIRIKEGTPVFGLKSFSAAGRNADIEGNAVYLHLPNGVSFYQEVEADYTGTGIEFLRSDKSKVLPDGQGRTDLSAASYIRIVNDYTAYLADSSSQAPVYTKDYDLIVTQGNSSACSMLSYSVGVQGETVIWSGNSIEVSIPYGTDWASVKAAYTVSYDAVVATPNDEDLKNSADTPVIYRVNAQNGVDHKDYSVRVIEVPASTEKNITSFMYGSLPAEIDNETGTVSLVLPSGSGRTFAPTLQVSEFASVEPASGVLQDFSDPVQYTVKAQDGSEKVYIVSVTVDTTVVENPRKAELQNLLNAIIGSYRASASDDWEWMDLGLYEGFEANDNNGFDIAKEIKDLNVGIDATTTDIDRLIMMLTARGYDCTRLADYNNGQPFIDAAGNEIDDLVANLYSSHAVGINGWVFSLIAFDMGNYTIPQNAVTTREAILEELINHEYLSDGWGIDMVGMLMYGLAPYQDDSVYGARVKAKLDEGVALIASMMKYNYAFESWDSINSEAASQVIAALSSCGVDCYTDPRFSSDSGNVLSCWLDKFAVGTGFKHIESGGSDVIATYEACYALQWYLGFLDHGGAGNPYYLYYHRWDFSKQLSSEADILSFSIDGKEGVITETEGEGNNNITVVLPKGMPLNGLTPKMELSEGATLIAPTLPVNFVEGVPQPFTVLAKDGVTAKSYYVTVTREDVSPSGSELDTGSIQLMDSNLRKLDILNKKVAKTETGADILLTVASGVDVSKIRLFASISYGAEATPSVEGEYDLDLSDWTELSIVSGDGANTSVYRIKVQARGQARIESFTVSINGKIYSGVIDHNAGTITVSGVDDSKLTSTVFTPDITLGEGTAVCSPLSGIPQDFSAPVVYTVAGNDIESRSYTVRILNTSGSIIKVKGGSDGQGDPTPHADPQTSIELWNLLEQNNTITDHQISRGPKKF